MKRLIVLLIVFTGLIVTSVAQANQISGLVRRNGTAVPNASVYLDKCQYVVMRKSQSVVFTHPPGDILTRKESCGSWTNGVTSTYSYGGGLFNLYYFLGNGSWYRIRATYVYGCLYIAQTPELFLWERGSPWAGYNLDLRQQC